MSIEEVERWERTRGAKSITGGSKQEVEGQEAGSHGWGQRVSGVGGGVNGSDVNKKERKCLL